MLEDIEYTLEFVKDETIALASIGKTVLLSPTSQAVIAYASSCGVPNLKTEQDIEELWWRISYLRRFDFSLFGDGKQSYKNNPLEPYLKDVQQLLGLVINEEPVARKQWLKLKQDWFINQNTNTYLKDENKLAPVELLKQRPELLRQFINENTNIRLPKNPINSQEQQTHQNTQMPENPVIPQDLVLDENGRLPPIDLTKINKPKPIIEPAQPQMKPPIMPNLPKEVLEGIEAMKKKQAEEKK